MTQTEWIIQRLKSGPITPLEALNEGGIFRLAARIRDLRDAGHSISTESIETPTGKRVARYHLTEWNQHGISQ